MSDILPKLKLYMFLCFLNVLVSLGFSLAKMGYEQKTDITGLLTSLGTAFIPFASLIQMIFTGMSVPPEALLFIGIFTGVISGVQTYIILMMVINVLPLFDV
jgi:hypothetical protein